MICSTNGKWKIGNDVRNILLEDPDITAMVGTKIFPLIAPENTVGDFLIYMREKYTINECKMGVYEEKCQLVINAISDNYDRAISLAASINNCLLGEHNLNNMIIRIELEDSTEAYDDNKYIETLLFTIK